MAWRNKIYSFGIASILAWALFVLMLYTNATEKDSEAIDSIALNEAKIAHRKDIIYRRWASRMGGMYVEATDSLQPNPYLEIPGRDVTTQDGRNLTLVNPAYMTRMVHSLMQEDDGLKAHITSRSPIRPQNAPDEWERKALESFNAGNAEAHEFLDSNGEHVLRYMEPMFTEESCLRCHARQGYKTGDIIGGISVTVPMRKYDSIRHANIVGTRKRYATILFTGSGFLVALFSMLLANERIRVKAAMASKQSADALRLSQAYMAMSMEMAAMGHWQFDVASRTFCFTDEFYALYGTSAKREGGSHMSAERYAREFVHPEDAGMVAEEVEKLFTAEDRNYFRQIEHRIIRRDGQARHIVVRFNAIRDESGAIVRTFGVNQDITERKHVENKLLRSERDLKAVLDNMPSMIGYWDKNLFNRFANQTYLDWYGLDPAYIAGQTLKELLVEKNYTSILPYVNAVLTGKRQAFERTTTRHGVRHLLADYVPDIVDGEVQGFYALVTDVTVLKESELALKASLSEKEVMLREIHHRVKNNLQIISSLLSLQENAVKNQDAIKILRDSQTRVMSMALIHDHLYKASDIAKIDAGNYLTELLRRIQRAYQGRCPVRLDIDIQPISLTLDQAIPFGLIMAELATNAFKHAFTDQHPHGIFSARGRQEDGKARFTLRDSGPGLPAGLTLEGTLSLGLQIVVMLVDQLHGTIAVESCDGLATRLEFPLR